VVGVVLVLMVLVLVLGVLVLMVGVLVITGRLALTAPPVYGIIHEHQETHMTKKEARAILICQQAIIRALDSCEEQLSDDELNYCQAYWGAHVRSAINGAAYGSAPIARALERAE
jgi:hypothetical protein